MVWLWIVGGVLLVIAIALWYLKSKAFEELRFAEQTFAESSYYYKDIQVHYHKLFPVYDALDAIMNNLGKPAQKLCVFFDNPTQAADPNLCRACVGFISQETLPEEAEKKVMEAGYSKTKIPAWRAVKTEIGNLGKISVVLGAMRAYPALFRYVGIRKDKYGPIAGIPVVEIHRKNAITYAFPLGEEKKAFLLTKHPEPAKKGKVKGD